MMRIEPPSLYTFFNDNGRFDGLKRNILILAPQPFFQERGTPIAVKLLCEVLGHRDDIAVHLLTYLEGDDIAISGITHHRSWAPSWLYGVKPGLSLKKLWLDLFFLFTFIKLIFRLKPALVHAVEEAAFMACFLTRTPFVFDMDSKVVDQAVSKWKILTIIAPLLAWIEHRTIQKADAVVAVCPVIADYASVHGAQRSILLPDISLLEETDEQSDIRSVLGVSDDAPVILYVGNFERYQGIDLLLESMSILHRSHSHVHLILVGGRAEHVTKYRERAQRLEIHAVTHFPGPRPSCDLRLLLNIATIVVSPRILGENTPMKLYSYLDSGKALVATKLITHTQIINDHHAFLADPTPEAFAATLQFALTHPEEAQARAMKAKELVQAQYQIEAFTSKVNQYLDDVLPSLNTLKS